LDAPCVQYLLLDMSVEQIANSRISVIAGKNAQMRIGKSTIAAAVAIKEEWL
jgi:hypothetical protein